MTNPSDGPTAMERFIGGIIPENPVFRQVLGMCPTLAVSNTMESAMTMAGSVLFVLVGANVLISLIRSLLKPHLRILVFTLTIAAFVTIIDRFLKAYMFDMSRQLGPYIPLIIVNCIIIARCEICAAKQSVGTAFMDAVGQSLGYALAIGMLATVREILGFGTWFGTWLGWRVIPATDASVWSNWVVMVLPPGAFIALGLLMGAVNWAQAVQKARKAA